VDKENCVDAEAEQVFALTNRILEMYAEQSIPPKIGGLACALLLAKLKLQTKLEFEVILHIDKKPHLTLVKNGE
jgi:hypothetical protein